MTFYIKKNWMGDLKSTSLVASLTVITITLKCEVFW